MADSLGTWDNLEKQEVENESMQLFFITLYIYQFNAYVLLIQEQMQHVASKLLWKDFQLAVKTNKKKPATVQHAFS